MTTDAVVIDSASPIAPSPTFIVGIGASAGGLEALEVLFRCAPRESGMAYVVVQHLSPDFKSMMNELLARHTQIPIFPVEDGMPVMPDCIYLIPPKKEMIISGGKLLLSDKAEKDFALPIDLFFRSLAQDVGSRAIGVILSGTGSDGSRGIREIHHTGGFVVVQTEETARFDGMPRSARETGCVDVFAGPEDIPSVLSDHLRRVASGAHTATQTVGPRGLAAIFTLLQDDFGIDFSHYKPTTVSRRIDRRMHLNHFNTLDDYVKRLNDSIDERNALYKDLLIGVTRFFRDGEMFEHLENHVFPDLLKAVGTDDELRIWVAGCATGEEAYTLAMIANDQLAKLPHPPRLKIFATDVHRASLDFASAGLYDEESIGEIPEARIAKYFTRHGGTYRVSQELRQHVVFAPHNLLKDAPFTKVHLISCRNMLIYLQPHAQKKVLSLFHFALRRGGVLFLGPSESPNPLGDDFELVDEHSRLYRKLRDLRLPAEARLPLPRPNGLRSTPIASTLPLTHVISTYDLLLEEHLPPSFLITERRELIHAFKGAGRFLRLRDGRPTLDVLDMVDPELKMALTGALQRALKEMKPVVYKGVRARTDTGDVLVRLTVKPIFNRSSNVRHLLVSFEHSETAPPKIEPVETEIDIGKVSTEQLITLESELRYTKENLQATIEELETSNEELQATNEELVASNEELQSTNEELQSVNEELYTVNAEFQKKISELTELTNDMDNLLSSTDIGTIFLDRDLCIRKFTPRIAESFNLLPQDIGRRIEIFANTLKFDGLLEDLEKVLQGAAPIQREVRDRSGTWFYLRILPYRQKGVKGGELGGVVITLVDISVLKNAESALFTERYLLESVMETAPDSIYFKDAAGKYIRINSAMAKRLGLAHPSSAIGKQASDFYSPGVVQNELAVEDEILRTGTGRTDSEEMHKGAGDHIDRWFITARMPLRDQHGEIVGSFGVSRDITERRRGEEEIREAVRRRDQFLAMLSHELRNPLGAIVSAAYLLQEASGVATVKDRALATIERQSSHMSRLLDDLLDVSRVTQNKIELDRKSVDLRVVLNDAVEVVRPRFAERGITIEAQLCEDPIFVMGDSARLQQIHVNLLNNACKFSKHDSKVFMSARVEDGEIITSVRDTGKGIPKDMLERVFELFVQCDSPIDRSEVGMGVGLTLVRSLVEMHDGSVVAQSDGAGKGTEVIVRLPRTTRPTERPRRLGVRLDGAGSKIVLVEDNEDSREMMRMILETMGFEVHTAANGTHGMRLIETVQPHVAFVDIGLPLTNGYQVASYVREQQLLQSVFMVALTGYGQPADRDRALEAGFDEHLVKPLTMERLTQLFSSGSAVS